ncbi:MAG: RibD family protein [Anaerolineaceae bacterium]|nr:RibD family protein [Anaerolineaceae bacterium]
MARIDGWLADADRRSEELGRPLVTLSYTESLDGCLTVQPGHATILSGIEAARLMHQLRAAHQAVLVGIGTVAADNPQLTVRLADGRNPQPVILDTFLRISDETNLLKRSSELPWIACGLETNVEQQEKLVQKGVKLIPAPADEQDKLNLVVVLKQLYKLGIHSLLVEGGAAVISSFLTARLVDQAVLTIAPIWLMGVPAVARQAQKGAGMPLLTRVPQLVDPVYETYGRDLVVWGKIQEVKS